MRRLAITTAGAVLATATIFLSTPSWADPGNVIYVSAGSEGGDGSSTTPYGTIAEAVDAAHDGDVIQVADGVYREGELYVDKAITIESAPGTAPILSGAIDNASWQAQGDGTWQTGADMVRFCTVCTTNVDPSVEGMAAHPEQVFVDGVPLVQVGSRAEVTESTFYVADSDPITLKDPSNNRAGYNTKSHRGAAYVIGVDPSQHHVEVVQHSRAISLSADGAALRGFVVEKYSPVQQWDYDDPEIGTQTGGAMVVASGAGVEVTSSTFRYSAAGTALVVTDAQNARMAHNTFTANGGVGAGINRSSHVAVEHNLWSDNNTAGFITADCGAYCTLSDMKVTHADNIRYAFNTVDYSHDGVDHSEPSSYATNRLVGVWFDEGVMDSEVVASYFVNVPVAIFNEVSARNTIASNVVEGSHTGIKISGSEDTRVWNNTVTHALTSLDVAEDSRSDGCNARDAQGACRHVESWSASKGLTWDTTGTVIYNNVFSSEQQVSEGDLWRYSAMVQVTGQADEVGGAVYANNMVSAIDYNIYYRQPTSAPSTTVLWQYGADRIRQSVNAASLADFQNHSDVTVTGKETQGLDLLGTRAENPILVQEAANPTAWKTSDLRASAGGPADDSGHPLPEDVATMLGLDADSVVDRGALVNVAWTAADSSVDQATPSPAAEQATPSPTTESSAEAIVTKPPAGQETSTAPSETSTQQAGAEATPAADHMAGTHVAATAQASETGGFGPWRIVAILGLGGSLLGAFVWFLVKPH